MADFNAPLHGRFIAPPDIRRMAPDLESYQVESIYYVACDRLAAWDVAQTVVEEFAANLRELSLGNRLIKYMMESGRTVDQIDQWLAHMPPGRENFWVKERLRFNVQQGRGDDLVQQLSHQVRKNPDGLSSTDLHSACPARCQADRAW
jgi:hypothetical protein